MPEFSATRSLSCFEHGESTSLSTQVFRSLAVSDVSSMSILKQCNFLDSILCTDFTNEVLGSHELSLKDLKKRILEADRQQIIQKSANHPSLSYVLRVARENMWMKFWEVALDHGPDGTKVSMAILKLLCLTLFSDRCCPIHDCSYIIPPNSPLCEHFMESHTSTLFDSNASPVYITNLIISCTSDSEHFMSLMSLGLSLKNVLPF